MSRQIVCIAALALAVIGTTSPSANATKRTANWSGFYFGFSAALTEQNGKSSATIGSPSTSSAHTLDDGETSVSGTLIGGANIQLQKLVLGVQVELDPFGTVIERSCRYDWNDGFDSNVFVFDTFVSACSRRVELTASVLAKAGVLVSNEILLYGLVGWTAANVKDNFTGLKALQSVSSRLDGLTFGAGVEIHLTSRWHVNTEIRSTVFEDFTSSIPVDAAQQHSNVEADTRTIRLGLTFHFDG